MSTYVVAQSVEGDAGQLVARFNEDIVIKSNSKLALTSLNTVVEPRTLLIDDTNNEIYTRYVLPPAPADTARLPLGLAVDDMATLLPEVEHALNRAVNATINSRIGVEYKVTEKANRISIEWKKSSRIDPQGQTLFVTPNVDVTAGGVYTRNGGAGNGDAYAGFQAAYCRGGGTLQMRIGNIPTGATGVNSMLLGLSSVKPEAGVTINIGDIAHGILMKGRADFYSTIRGGVEVVAGTAPHVAGNNDNDNDYVVLRADGDGHVRYDIYRNDVPPGAITPLGIDAYDVTATYYPVLIIYTDANTSANLLRMTLSPWNHDSINAPEPITDDSLGINPDRGTMNRMADVSLTFQGEMLARYMGFPLASGPFAATTQHEFLGVTLGLGVIPRAFFISIEDFGQLSSFADGKRARVIAHIVRERDTKRVEFIPAFPIYHSLRNSYDVYARTFSLRLLNEDYNAIEVAGKTTICLHIVS